jgi:hypothetical protein
MVKDFLQGSMGYGASQARIRVCKQVRVCNMQDPNRISRRLNSATTLCWRGVPQSPGPR